MLIVKQKKKVTDFVSLTCLSRHERIISDGEGREIIFIEMATRLYKLLGVAKSASKQEIKQAYRNLALQFHPDKHAQSPKQMRDAVAEIFSQITAAHETLTDERRRAAYDRSPDHHHQSHHSYQYKKEHQSHQSENQYKKEHQSHQSQNQNQYKKEHQSRQSQNQHNKKEEENSWARRFISLDGPTMPQAVTVLIIWVAWDVVRYKDRLEKLEKKQESEVEELREEQEGELEELRKRQVRELEENGARHERDLRRCSTGHERAELRVAHERQLEEHRARHQLQLEDHRAKHERQRNEQRERHQHEITQI